MKLSYNILKQYIDLSDISPFQLQKLLTNAGLEVEGVVPYVYGDQLVIGQIISVERVKDSDHLNYCSVDIKDDILNIICGANNVRVGAKVIVAKDGCKLKDLTIKKTTIKGYESNGMLCSLLELGYDKKFIDIDDGIYILDDDAVVGDDPLKYLCLDDYILDFKPTPNRKDTLAYFYLIYEIKALLNRDINLPKINQYKIGLDTKLKVDIKSDKCSLFLGKLINYIKIKESPVWLKEYLHASGIKSINNIVDISNYVMLETGQPLHFYDAEKIRDYHIGVSDNYRIKYRALDDLEYDIIEDDIVITNIDKVIGIGGIIGGNDSKIDDSTRSIIIESALFDHVSIRKTSKRFNLLTEATIRFSKGVIKESCYMAINRAMDLLIEYGDAKDYEDTIVFNGSDSIEKGLSFNYQDINKILGTRYSIGDIIRPLELLSFRPIVDGDIISIVIPYYRSDISIVHDIAEEVIRLNGYDTMDDHISSVSFLKGCISDRMVDERYIKDYLVSNGLNEVISYTLVSKDSVNNQVLALSSPYKILYPFSEDRAYIRNGLFDSLLDTYNYNLSFKNINNNIFELSYVYGKDQYKMHLGVLISQSIVNNPLLDHRIDSDFYVLKGIIKGLLIDLGYKSKRIVFKVNGDIKQLHPYQCADIFIDNDRVGVIGTVNTSVVGYKNLLDCYYCEVDIDQLFSHKVGNSVIDSISKFPIVSRDLSFIVKEEVCASDIIKVVNSSSSIISNVLIFDIYQGDNIDKGYKSVALSFDYQSKDNTLKEQEINEIYNRVISNLEHKCKAIIRK